MSYSKIKTLKLTNFMSIATAEIPIGAITNICGYNDQGKSAIRTALSVVMYDSDSNDQVKFIKDGTEYFEIECLFEDGVSISKVKKHNGASIWTMKQGNTVVYTNMTGDKVISVEDVPEAIAQYWGVYQDETTGQLLNVRIDRDPFFLVDTSGGDNYKILSPLLHSEVLSKASAELIKDSNVCKSEIEDQTTRYNMYAEMLENKVAPTEEMLNVLQNTINNVATVKVKQEILEGIIAENNVINTTAIAPEVTLVDIDKLNAIAAIKNVAETANERIYDEVALVDVRKLQLVEQLMQASKTAMETEGAPELCPVSSSKLELIYNIMCANTNVLELQAMVAEIDTQLVAINNELDIAKKALTDAGYRICKNCGNLVD